MIVTLGGAGRWITIALASTLFSMAAVVCTGGFLAYRASSRVTVATSLHEGYDRARHALTEQEAHKHEYLSELLGPVHEEFVADGVELRSALTDLRAMGDPGAAAVAAHAMELHDAYAVHVADVMILMEAGDREAAIDLDDDEVDP